MTRFTTAFLTACFVLLFASQTFAGDYVKEVVVKNMLSESISLIVDYGLTSETAEIEAGGSKRFIDPNAQTLVSKKSGWLIMVASSGTCAEAKLEINCYGGMCIVEPMDLKSGCGADGTVSSDGSAEVYFLAR